MNPENQTKLALLMVAVGQVARAYAVPVFVIGYYADDTFPGKDRLGQIVSDILAPRHLHPINLRLAVVRKLQENGVSREEAIDMLHAASHWLRSLESFAL